MGLSSHRRRRRRAVDGEQLLALGACGAAAVAEAGREACTKAGRAEENGYWPLFHYGVGTKLAACKDTSKTRSC